MKIFKSRIRQTFKNKEKFFNKKQNGGKDKIFRKYIINVLSFKDIIFTEDSKIDLRNYTNIIILELKRIILD